ncbi:MAG TPA: nucleotide exchange factor GrpE [Pirellulales bacterium]|nr:nucleotide exchange factor GrpE [Pirellulales bacterium]
MLPNADDERLLERLGQWVRETRAAADELERNGVSPPAAAAGSANGQGPGIYRIAEELTAQRHEVKLHTKEARSLEDAAQTLLEGLGRAIDALQTIEPKEAQAAWSAGNALALALAELDEALERGRLQTEKAAAGLLDEPSDAFVRALDEFHQQQSPLRRRLSEGYRRELAQWILRREPDRRRQALCDSLVDGYRLIQKRVAQTMLAQGLARINAAGKPVDPEQMIVVEAVDDPELPDGTVREEIRRGYTWNGRVLRCAEVRATRNPGARNPA